MTSLPGPVSTSCDYSLPYFDYLYTPAPRGASHCKPLLPLRDQVLDLKSVMNVTRMLHQSGEFCRFVLCLTDMMLHGVSRPFWAHVELSLASDNATHEELRRMLLEVLDYQFLTGRVVSALIKIFLVRRIVHLPLSIDVTRTN
jgi:hypothetical protein